MDLFDVNPGRADVAPGSYSEPDFEYLNRSARPAAKAIRELLNEWFSHYPEGAKVELRSNFRAKDNVQHASAFFELYIHELLLVHGYEVDVHPELANSPKRRPDFLARKGNQEIYVEAVLATDHSAKEAAAEARLNQAYDALNKIDSPNFFLGINVYGIPSTPIPQNELRNAVQKFLENLNPEAVSILLSGGLANAPRGMFSHAGCTIEFFPIPKSIEARGKPGLRPLGMLGPGEAKFIDDTRALKNAIATKAKRYGEMKKPFVIAVNAMSQHLDSLDMNDALFGQESGTVYDDINRAALPKTNRTMNGVWLRRKGPANTRVSAVLIASSVSPWSLHVRKPIVYVNPWAKYPIHDLLDNVTSVLPLGNRLTIKAGKAPNEVFALPSALVDAFNNHN